MLYHNQLVATGMVNDGDDALNVNVDKSYRRGVELMASYKAAKWLTLSANTTLSQNKIENYVDQMKDSPTYGQNLGTKTISYSPSVVGAFIGTIPAVFLLFLVEPMQAVWFLVFILVLQQLEGHVIYPKVVGESVGLPALWVLLGIMAGGGLGGVPGMLLGVPLFTVGYKLLSRTIQRRLDIKKISV